jgi:hypothetical protein
MLAVVARRFCGVSARYQISLGARALPRLRHGPDGDFVIHGANATGISTGCAKVHCPPNRLERAPWEALGAAAMQFEEQAF